MSFKIIPESNLSAYAAAKCTRLHLVHKLAQFSFFLCNRKKILFQFVSVAVYKTIIFGTCPPVTLILYFHYRK
jgi:hypothetical protein